MITFSNEAPDWVKDWITWGTNLLLPQWDVCIELVDSFQHDAIHPDIPDERFAESTSDSEYMHCEIKALSSLQDDHNGHVFLIHELCHAFLMIMTDTAGNLITNQNIRKFAWKAFNAAEETRVVILSRLLVSLREAQLVENKGME